MFGTNSNGKSVMVREDKRFCRSPQFSFHFPRKLSGIIHPNEFEESIANINHACRPTLCEKILILSLYLCCLIGLLVFIGGISVIWLSITALWIPLMSIGFVVFMIFLTTAIFVSSRVYQLCDTRLDKAVETESRKYSTRLPVPTRWRLDMTIYTRRNSTASPTDIQYYLIIDIGEKSTLEVRTDAPNRSSSLSKLASDVGQRYLTVPSAYANPSTRRSSEKTLRFKDQAPIHTSA